MDELTVDSGFSQFGEQEYESVFTENCFNNRPQIQALWEQVCAHNLMQRVVEFYPKSLEAAGFSIAYGESDPDDRAVIESAIDRRHLLSMLRNAHVFANVAGTCDQFLIDYQDDGDIDLPPKEENIGELGKPRIIEAMGQYACGSREISIYSGLPFIPPYVPQLSDRPYSLAQGVSAAHKLYLESVEELARAQRKPYITSIREKNVGQSRRKAEGLAMGWLEKRIKAFKRLRSLGVFFGDLDNAEINIIPIPMAELVNQHNEIRRHLCSVSGVPESSLFGFNSGSESLNRDERDRILVAENCKKEFDKWAKPIERYVHAIIHWLFNSGEISEVPSFTISHGDYFPMSPKEAAEMRHRQAEDDRIYVETGVLAPETIAASRFGAQWKWGTDIEGDAETWAQERDRVYARYHANVNMTHSEMQKWAEDPRSNYASLSREPITRNLRLLGKPKDEWTPADVRGANRTISFNSRMRGTLRDRTKGMGTEVRGSGLSKVTISLLNWAWNPYKAEGRSIPTGEKR